MKLFILFLFLNYFNHFFNQNSSDWFDKNNWSLNHIPNNQDNVIIDSNLVVNLYDHNKTNASIQNLYVKQNTIFGIYNKIYTNNLINNGFIMLFDEMNVYNISQLGIFWMNNAIINIENLFINQRDHLRINIGSNNTFINGNIYNNGILSLSPMSKVFIKNYYQYNGTLNINIQNDIPVIITNNAIINGTITIQKDNTRKNKIICGNIINSKNIIFDPKITPNDFIVNITQNKNNIQICIKN